MKLLKNLLTGGILLCAYAITAQESAQWSSARPDGHAPIQVMGDHTHNKGEFMFAIRSMHMRMDGAISGTKDIETTEILDMYMVAPKTMQMNMQMLGMMYAPSDRITLMLMGNYQSTTMELQTRMGVDFATASQGFGDTKISALISLLDKKRQIVLATVGTSLPTGGIVNRDDTPMMANSLLAYPMQNGSGTVDPFVGITYQGQAERFSWGAQSSYLYRATQNNRGYQLGDYFKATLWGALKLNRNFSLSLSADFGSMGKIEGVDSDLNPMMMPLASTMNSGNQRLHTGIGANYYVPSGTMKNLRIGIVVMYPAWQKVSGIQMNQSLQGTLGLQYTIGD